MWHDPAHVVLHRGLAELARRQAFQPERVTVQAGITKLLGKNWLTASSGQSGQYAVTCTEEINLFRGTQARLRKEGPFSFSPTDESFGVSAQIGSGVRRGPEAKVPRGFHEASTRLPGGSARAAGLRALRAPHPHAVGDIT